MGVWPPAPGGGVGCVGGAARRLFLVVAVLRIQQALPRGRAAVCREFDKCRGFNPRCGRTVKRERKIG